MAAAVPPAIVRPAAVPAEYRLHPGARGEATGPRQCRSAPACRRMATRPRPPPTSWEESCPLPRRRRTLRWVRLPRRGRDWHRWATRRDCAGHLAAGRDDGDVDVRSCTIGAAGEPATGAPEASGRAPRSDTRSPGKSLGGQAAVPHVATQMEVTGLLRWAGAVHAPWRVRLVMPRSAVSQARTNHS